LDYLKDRDMYSVRRFSTTLSLEEREYNIASDLYHSGLGRASKKVIGRIRRDLGAKIERSIINKSSKISEYNELDRILKVPAPPRMTRKLSREANVRNSRVMGNISPDSEVFIPESFDKTKLENLRRSAFIPGIKKKDKVSALISHKELSSGKKLISYPRNKLITDNPAGIDDLAHEIGHVDNGLSNGIKRLIHRKAGYYRPLMEINNPNNINKRGLLNSLKNLIKGETMVLEESNASRSGLRLLKKNGASKDVLGRSKRSLDNSLKTYKNARDNMSLYPIRNSIQIPSRRNLKITDYGFGKSDPASNIDRLRGRKR
jgi:hypothetical protein